MELRDIEDFAAVAEHGHVGRAAEALAMSQSALSKCLRRIEHAIGAKIVKRTPKGIELTAAGTALLPHVRRLRLAHEDIAREIADLGQGRAGHLRIGANTGIPEALVGTACPILVRDAPGVTLQVTVNAVNPLIAALRAGEFELAVSGISATSREGLLHEPLFDDEFIVCASARHRLAKRKRVTAGELAGEGWALGDSGVSWQGLRQGIEKEGLPLPRTVVASNAASVRFRAVAGSDLLGYTSRVLLRQFAQRYKLVELPVKELVWQRSVGVVYRRDTYLPPAARRFIEILKATAKEIAADKP